MIFDGTIVPSSSEASSSENADSVVSSLCFQDEVRKDCTALSHAWSHGGILPGGDHCGIYLPFHGARG